MNQAEDLKGLEEDITSIIENVLAHPTIKENNVKKRSALLGLNIGMCIGMELAVAVNENEGVLQSC